MSMNKKEIESYILSVVRKNPQGFFLKSFSKALSGYSKTRVTMQEKDFFGELSDYSVSEVESIINNMIDKKLLITGDYKGKIKIFAPQKIKSNPLDTIIKLIDMGKNVFITGGGGVGKSYILGKLKEHYEDDLDITSTTGISAVNINGQTIHSWAGIGIANKNIDEVVRKIRKKKSLESNIKNCKILAIDEISMMSDRILKYLDAVLKRIRGNREVFGGLQVILIGDFFQLPPVKKDNPTDDYCFNSAVWARFNLYKIYLKEIKRQTDTKYIEALNKIRVGGSIPPNVIKLFKDREVASKDELDKNILQIFPLKENTKKYNDNRLAELTTKLYTYPAQDTFYRYDIETNKCTETININDDFDLLDRSEKLAVNSFNDRHCNAPKILTLKEGCRVMLLRNLDISKKLVNGTCGTVTKLTDNSIYVLFDNKSSAQKIEKETFEYIKEGKTIIRRHQYPLTLAYAINNHKSQGMTFDELVVNFEGTFEDGMAYVILSRTRTLEGLHLIGFKPELIHANDDVKDFYKNLEKDPKCIIFGDKIESKNIVESEGYPNSEDISNNRDDKEENDKNFDKEIMDDVVNRVKLDLKEDISSELKDEIKKIVKETVIEALSQYSQKENPDIIENKQDEVEENRQEEDIFEDEENIEIVDDAEENDEDNYFVKAFVKYKDEEYDEAFDLFIKHLEEKPDDDKAYNYLGRICEIEEDYESAIKVYTDAIELNKNSTMHLNNRANAYYDIKEYEKAINDWNNILIVDPKYEINYFRKAYAEYKRENYDQSIKDYSVYLENHPEDAVAYNNIGLAKEYSDNYSYQNAIEDYTKAINIEPNNIRLNNRANAYYEIKEYEKAKADYLKVLEYNIDEETRQEINEKLKIINILYNSKKQVVKEIEDSFLENPILKLGPEETREVLEYEYKRGNYKKVIDICQEIEYGFDDDMFTEDILVCDLLAKSYYKNKQYDDAIEYWNKILSYEEDYEIDYMSKGSAELQVGNYDQAIKDFTSYLEIYPDSACAHFSIGLAKECADDYSIKDAIKDYTQAIKLDKKNTIYLNERAEAYYEINDYKKAVKDWEKVLKLDSEYKIDYFDKGYAEHEIENYEQAIEDYTTYLENNPENANAYNNRGWAKECSDNYTYKEAIKDYSESLRINPNDQNHLNNRARAYYWDDEYAKAIDDWKKILEIDSEYEINYYWKAYAENEIGLYENALSSIEKYLIDNPNNKDALKLKNTISNNLSKNSNENLISEYLKKAESYYESKEYEKAVDNWNKVLEIDPKYEIDYMAKGAAEHEIKNYEQAIKDFSTYLEIYPDFACAYYGRGRAKVCSENYNIEYIIDDFIKAINLDENNTMYLSDLAYAYYFNKDYEEASEVWNKILEIDPEYEINYFQKGYTEDELENYDQAIEDYTKYLENDPDVDVAVAYNNRGWAKECSDNYSYEDAIEDYNKAIELESDETMYLNNRARAYYKIKEYEKAQEDYLRVLEYDIDEETHKEINEKLEELKILSSKDIREKLSNAREELNKGNYDKVIMLCNQVLSNVKDTDAYFIRGNAHYLDNNKFDAKIDYKTTLMHNPKFGKVWFNLGIIEEEAGRDKSALYHYEKAIKFDKSIKDIVKKKIKNLKNKISKNKDYDSSDSYNYEDDYD